jgi:hypothetical protein
MRTQFESLQLFFGALAVLIMTTVMIPMAKASVQPIECRTNFGEKSFTIQKNTIAFHTEQNDGRSISSVLGSVTKKTHYGFKKTIYRNGFKHFISVKNENEFNSDEDFLAITSPKGHKMTYPLNCSLVE